jgi:hypothetical protein
VRRTGSDIINSRKAQQSTVNSVSLHLVNNFSSAPMPFASGNTTCLMSWLRLVVEALQRSPKSVGDVEARLVRF